MRKVLNLILGLFIGIVVLIIGISTYIKNINELKNGVTVEATITKIIKQKEFKSRMRSAPGSRSSYRYDIYVEYEYEGIEYKDKWINLDSNLLKVGDKIYVKIDKDNPDVPIYIEQTKIAIIIIIIGILLIIFEIVINIFIF